MVPLSCKASYSDCISLTIQVSLYHCDCITVSNPPQEGYYNSINPLLEGVAHIFTGFNYSGASDVTHTYFPVSQFIVLQ